MEVELTTGNLRTLCRICLGEGDYNLWEHKVRWNNEEDNTALETLLREAEEITVYEALQMYNDWQTSVLDLDGELHQICKVCLDELQPHYRFYRRLCAANKQLKHLYQEALHQERNNSAVIENQMVIEQVAFGNSLQEYLDITIEDLQPVKSPETQESFNSAELAPIHPNTLPKQVVNRRVVKNPKFILTDGVTQLLTHASEAASIPLAVAADKQKRAATSQYSPLKRQRKEEVDDGAFKLKEKPSREILFADHRSNVVHNQREASEHVVEHSSVMTIVEEQVEALPPTEILTIDYTPVEPRTEVISSISKEDKSFGSDEQAAEPFSTLSADDTGRTIYVCKYCPQAFTAPCFLLTHARKSHVCKYCTQAFVKTSELFAHVKNAHQEHKCTVCGKELSSNGNLRAHIKRMHQFKMIDAPPQVVVQPYKNTVVIEEKSDNIEENVYYETSMHTTQAEYIH